MVHESLLALQNLTWNGDQGLSEFPCKELFVPYYPQGVVAQSGNGVLGHWTETRGLTFDPVRLSGQKSRDTSQVLPTDISRSFWDESRAWTRKESDFRHGSLAFVALERRTRRTESRFDPDS
ncbi:hypothetical protein PV11_04943 [Exophiala sideris]|uniref:Uncharacterized protein n=1 Tax=Exophiala sideris TaxID=1016849 RepID=A0A0D1X597_9EURO|nr:hypothetical protein PV11_04943 [Exophiala sideris]